MNFGSDHLISLHKISKNVIISLAILLTGILLRIVVLIQNRSLIIDEANLARNIIERDYLQFFSPLDYEQYAPPLFSSLTKAFTQIFGVNEFALKILPFVGGVLSLVLIFLLCRRMIKYSFARWYILAMFGFSILAIRYSTEFKQYASDAALSSLAIYLAIIWKGSHLDHAKYIFWILFGVLVTWLSMPMVFILFTILIYFIWHDKTLNFKYVLMGILWGTSFSIYFLLILKGDTQAANLKAFHNPYFFDLFPTSLEAFTKDYKLLISLFRTASDKTALSIIWVLIAFMAGMLKLYNSDKPILFLLVFPSFMMFFASGLELYSLLPRMTLFYLPIMYMVIAIGICFIWDQIPNSLKWVLIGILFISLINKEGYKYFTRPMEFENSKAVLKYIQDQKNEDDLLVIHNEAIPAFQFYNQLSENAFQFKNFLYAESNSSLSFQDLEEERPLNIWVVFFHTFNEQEIEKTLLKFSKDGVLIDQIQEAYASAYRFELE